MAVTQNATSWVMTDADFLALNGAAAPNITQRGIFGGLTDRTARVGTANLGVPQTYPLTAASSGGNTTVTLTAGVRNGHYSSIINGRLRRYMYSFAGEGGVTINV